MTLLDFTTENVIFEVALEVGKNKISFLYRVITMSEC